MTSTSPNLFPEIPGYTLTEQLYLGSRTAVYRAIQTPQQRSVVIKVLRRDYPSFGELVQFRNQYTIAKNLPISGIVQPLSLESVGNSYALVMEDCGGIALGEYAQQQPLELTEVLTIALQLADILHELCQHRVVHKDIKPANILIHPESKQVKLIDFSIASLLPKETQEIQSPNILEGTLAYLAPEQTGRMNRGIDYRADFYALGVTLYQLLSGTLPFTSNDPLELMHSHIAKIPTFPHCLHPTPHSLVEIVMKLMAKNAEDRYQSALGLKYDLEQCLIQLQETGEVTTFELGQRDLSDRFLIPEKLYGREVEVQQLLEAFDRVASPVQKGGRAEMMLVAGFSGIGKTAVVNEVHKPIVRQRGYFIKGKFDQFNRNIPLSAFVQALRNLIEQLLCESDAQLAQWKAKILDALGENGQVLIEVIPELEQIIGSQPSVPELSGDAAQNRFNLLFQKFIAVFTTVEHPLVIFLDDLQWADLASLQLIKLLMNDSSYLLMLGAYRDNEVSPAHPFMMTVEELKKIKTVVNTIPLKPLAFEDTNHLVADTLNCSTELAQPLTELIQRKTKGNPFFTTQFLKALHEEGCITFNRDRCHWQCDIVQVNALSLFEIVNHLNLGRTLATQASQRLELAALNTSAAQRAKQATAYDSAITYAVLSLELFGKNAWSEHYEQCLHSSNLLAEVAYLAGDFEQVKRTTQIILENTQQTVLDQVKAYEIQILTAIADNRMLTAVELGIEVLEQLGVKLPTVPNETDFMNGLQAVQIALAGKAVEDLLDLPRMRDPQALAIMELLNVMVSPAYGVLPGLYPLLIFQQLQLSLEFGNSTFSSCAYSAYGLLLCGVMGNLKTGGQFGRLAMHLIDKLDDQFNFSSVALLTNGFIFHWQTHLSNTLSPLRLGYSQGTEIGNIEWAGYCLFVYSLHQYFRGQHLDELASHLKDYSQAIANLNQTPTFYKNEILRQVVLNLQSDSHQSSHRAGETFDEAQMYSFLQQSKDQSIFTYLYLGKMMLSYWLGDYRNAIENSELTFNALPAVPGMHVVPIFYFYDSLCQLADTPPLSPDEFQQRLEKVKHNQQKLKDWADAAPMNLQHKCDLVEAEQCRVQDERLTAIELYDQAIAGAKENGYLQEEALANELAAKFYLNWGKEKVAAGYMQEAYYCYSRWGARAKVQDLEHRYPQLLAPILQQQPASLSAIKTLFSTPTLAPCQASATQSSSSGSTSISASLDLATVFKASQTLSSQIELDKLLATLMQTVLENAGADHGVLLMPHAQEWFVEAVVHLSQLARVESIALAESSEFPHGLIYQVKRSLQPVVIVDATVHPTWSTDDYIVQQQPKSLLCTPILQQGKLVAILYLENQVSIGAFTRDRVELLNFLCTQAAISLENARLYSEIQESRCQLKRLLSNLPGMAYSCANDENWTMYIVSEGCYPLTGYYPEEFIKNRDISYAILIHPDDAEMVNATIENALQNHQPFQLSYRIRTKNGEEKWVWEQGQGVFDQAGNLLKLEGLVIDISDRKVAEAALVESEAYHRSLLDTCSIGLILCRMNGDILYTNAAYDYILGRTQAELSSLSYWDITPEKYAEAEQLQLQSLETTGRYSPYEKEYLHKDGHLVPVRLSGVLVERHGETFIWSTLEDISDRKAAEKLIQEKNEALEKALTELQHSQAQVIQAEKMSALGNLVAGVAHEINNPLGFLNGSIHNAEEYVQDLLEHLELIQQHHPNMAEPVLENVDEIDLEFLREDLPQLLESMKGATDRIKNISTSLRTFSRADTEHKVSANLHDGIDSTLLILKYRLKASEHRPIIQVIQDYGDLPVINCFPGQLNQVFMNILANAIDMFNEMAQQLSPEELKKLDQMITIKTEFMPEKNTVQIGIRDNGKGMTEDIQARIFEQLFTTKAVGKGTGLGLAIARQIVVEKHGGQLLCHSTFGEGTEFIIQIPA